MSEAEVRGAREAEERRDERPRRRRADDAAPGAEAKEKDAESE